MELIGRRHNLQVTQINISINWDTVLWEEKVAWFNSDNFLQICILWVCFSVDRPLNCSLSGRCTDVTTPDPGAHSLPALALTKAGLALRKGGLSACDISVFAQENDLQRPLLLATWLLFFCLWMLFSDRWDGMCPRYLNESFTLLMRVTPACIKLYRTFSSTLHFFVPLYFCPFMPRKVHGLLFFFIKVLQEADIVPSRFGEKVAHTFMGLLYDTGTCAAQDDAGGS